MAPPVLHSQVIIDLRERCLQLLTPLSTTTSSSSSLGKLYKVVFPFRHLRRRLLLSIKDGTLSFTTGKPPKILERIGDGTQDGEETWQLVCDPTAAAEGRAGEAGGGGVLAGSGLAGADGLLGRCLTFKLALSSYALKGMCRSLSVLGTGEFQCGDGWPVCSLPHRCLLLPTVLNPCQCKHTTNNQVSNPSMPSKSCSSSSTGPKCRREFYVRILNPSLAVWLVWTT